MTIDRRWAMPSKDTFSIGPIKELVSNYFENGTMAIDPFCGSSPFKGLCVTNDIDPTIVANFHVDALEFVQCFDPESVDLVLFDPPYSPRQVSEVYRGLDKTVNMQTTQASFWSDLKKAIRRIVRPGGHVITCGWNSGGIGGEAFRIVEILLVPHGGWHNDTIVTVEKHVAGSLWLS